MPIRNNMSSKNVLLDVTQLTPTSIIYLDPFHFMLFEFKYLVAKQHPMNTSICSYKQC